MSAADVRMDRPRAVAVAKAFVALSEPPTEKSVFELFGLPDAEPWERA